MNNEIKKGELIGDIVEKHFNNLKKLDATPLGYKLGFPLYDKKTRGAKEGDLTIISALPGGGKSAIMLQFAKSYWQHSQKKSLIISIEMSGETIAERMISNVARISGEELDEIAERTIKPTEIERRLNIIDEQLEQIKSIPIIIDAVNGNEISNIKKSIIKHVEEEQVKIVFVDYLQLVAIKDRNENERSRLDYITSELKGLAKELKIHVYILVQLNKNYENRKAKFKDSKPIQADLSGSSMMAQAASLIVFLLPVENSTLLSLYILKNRHGQPNIEIPFQWKMEHGIYVEMSEENGYKKTEQGWRKKGNIVKEDKKIFGSAYQSE